MNSYISDYGDVLVSKALLKGTLAAILVQYAYNLNADIAGEANNTAQVFLSNNPNFLTLATDYSTSLALAQTYLSQIADDLTAAINIIQTRNTPDYLINLAGRTTQCFNDAKADIADSKTSLSGQLTVNKGMDGISGTADDDIRDLSPFFAGLSLRDLLPPITGNNASGYFPDATMGGVYVQGYNPNEDKNLNGIPDILE